MMFREVSDTPSVESIQPTEVNRQTERLNSIPEFVAPGRTWGSFWDRFKKVAGLFLDVPLPWSVVRSTQRDELSREKRATHEGVNFSRCQMDTLVQDYLNGKRFEFESYSPYASDYNQKTGEIWEGKLVKADTVGLEVGKMLRNTFSAPWARLICLWDAYNTGMSEDTDFWGKPRDPTKKYPEKHGGVHVAQLRLPEETQKKFSENVESLMRRRGLIRSTDVKDRDYLLISESAKVHDAEQLVKLLDEKGLIRRNGEAIYFFNPDAENPFYKEIDLRRSDGGWLCEALDASAFLKPENLEITHLVILPNYFKKQQDSVWEILRVLGIKPTNYHNIFYDENVAPEKVTAVIREQIERIMKAAQEMS